MTKKLKKLLGLLLAAMTICSVFVLTGSAASSKNVPSLQVVSTDDDEINLKWSAVKGATGYQIYVKTPGGSWKKNETTKSTKEDAENLKSATTYYVKVRAYKKSGSKVSYGSFSNTVKTSTEPDEVKNLKASAVKNGKATISWKAVSGAKGYQVYKYTSGKWSRLVNTAKTSYTVSGCKSGDRFRIRAYLILDGKAYYGDTETVTLKAASSNKPTTPDTPSASDSKITAAEAKSIAIKDSKVSSSSVRDYECEYEYSKRFGCYVYEIDFESGRYEYEYIIAASSGKILSYHRERA